MIAGEQWRHRKTGDLVRIEVHLLGLLSFSVYRDGRWRMCRHIWLEEHFRKEFVIQRDFGDA